MFERSFNTQLVRRYLTARGAAIAARAQTTSRHGRGVFHFSSRRVRHRAHRKDGPMGIAEQISTEAAALQQRWDTEERWRGVVRPYTAEEVVRLRGRIRETHGFAIEAADQALGPARHRGLRGDARLPHREPGGRVRQGGTSRDLPLGVAGGRRREPVGPDLPRSVAVPGQLGPGGRAAHQQRVAPRRPDRVGGGPRGRLPRPDRGRRRGRVRRPAERLRADDLDDQGRRRGRALRGPASSSRRSAATSAARC